MLKAGDTTIGVPNICVPVEAIKNPHVPDVGNSLNHHSISAGSSISKSDTSTCPEMSLGRRWARVDARFSFFDEILPIILKMGGRIALESVSENRRWLRHLDGLHVFLCYCL